MSANVAYKPDGLDSLLLEEDDIRSYEESKGDVGGIADLGPIRERMEKAGRYGDDRVAHVQTGELVVPKPLIDKFPELKASIFEHLREMGVEDPERYMVGDGENSINPETGLPEFGFFSSITRGLKSIVKSVGKVLKKVAPTLITIAGTALLGPAGLGLNAVLAGGISSGIGTLVGGGSLKDAAISAALGGATAGLAPSIGDTAAFALQGGARAAIAGGDFSDVLKGAGIGAAGAAAGKIFKPTLQNLLPGGKTVADPFQAGLDNLSQDLGRTGSFLSDVTNLEFEKAFQDSGEAFKGLVTNPLGDAPKTIEEFLTPSSSATGTEVPRAQPSPSLIQNISSSEPTSNLYEAYTMDDAGNVYEMRNKITGEIISANTAAPAASDQMQELINAQMQEGYQPPPMPVLPPETGIGDNLGAGVKKVTDSLGNAYNTLTGTPDFNEADIIANNPNVPLETRKLFEAAKAGGETPFAAAKYALKEAQPTFLRKVAPLAAVGAGAAYLGGAFDVPEMQKPNILPSGFGQQGVDPELVAKYRLSEGSLNTSPTRTSPISARVAPRRQSDILRRRFPGLFAAKDGGEVFPRRTGGIMPDEGVPGKDSVRAMVMPGEFIFTTDAVRGASPTGNLNDGINNMYSVMRKLESRGKRMA
jgi:hypothetical protein